MLKASDGLARRHVNENVRHSELARTLQLQVARLK